MTGKIAALRARVEAASGADRALDAEIAACFGVAGPPPDYSASVDRCLELIHGHLAGWAWHVGWNASGVLPYATLHRGDHLLAAAAPTVPLALLRALLHALDLSADAARLER